MSSTSSAGLKQMYLDCIPLPLSVQGNPLDPLRLGRTLCQVLQSVAHTLCSNIGETHSPALRLLRTPPSEPPPTHTCSYPAVPQGVLLYTTHMCPTLGITSELKAPHSGMLHETRGMSGYTPRELGSMDTDNQQLQTSWLAAHNTKEATHTRTHNKKPER